MFLFLSESVIKILIHARNLQKEKKEAIEKMLTQIVQAYDKHNDHSRDDVEGLNSFTDMLIDTYNVLLLMVCEGSIVVILECPTLESLDHLWSDYLSGDLDKVAERYLVTDEVKKKLNLETTCLKTAIDKENYSECRRALMKLPSTPPGEYKQNIWEVQLYEVVNEESSLAFQFQECAICQCCLGRSAIMIIITVIVISTTTIMMITLIVICIGPTL